MNNLDEEYGSAAAIVNSEAPYHASVDNIVAGCPDPSAHGANDDVTQK